MICCDIAAGTSNTKLSCHIWSLLSWLAISFETHISLSRIGCISVYSVSQSSSEPVLATIVVQSGRMRWPC